MFNQNHYNNERKYDLKSKYIHTKTDKIQKIGSKSNSFDNSNIQSNKYHHNIQQIQKENNLGL